MNSKGFKTHNYGGRDDVNTLQRGNFIDNSKNVHQHNTTINYDFFPNKFGFDQESIFSTLSSLSLDLVEDLKQLNH